jgi:hypothetical protein
VDEIVAGWTADGRGLWVWRHGEIPARVYQLDVASGRRSLWKEIRPRHTTGVSGLRNLFIAPNGRAVYNYAQVLSELYLVEGAR